MLVPLQSVSAVLSVTQYCFICFNSITNGLLLNSAVNEDIYYFLVLHWSTVLILCMDCKRQRE